MSDIVLTITQPAHGSGLNGAVLLKGSASGDTAGLFLKWFSSLNALASQAHPELNTLDHSAACLAGSVTALGEFGSHTVVLAATDQDGIDLPAIKAVTRAALAGGAPPAAPAPCVVHQVSGAVIRTPATNNLPLPLPKLSKLLPIIEIAAPGDWAKPDAKLAGVWIDNLDYQTLNGVALRLNLAPVDAPTPANSADIALDLRDLPTRPKLPFFRADDKTWLRWTGPLPDHALAKLGTGAHLLSLIASAGTGAGAASATVSRKVDLTA